MAGGDLRRDLKPVEFDSKVWYHLTEGRADHGYDDGPFNATFTENDDGVLVSSNVTTDSVTWQFMPVAKDKPGRYAVRSSVHHLSKQLAVCYRQDEVDNYHTEPCMSASDGSEKQKWDIADWGDGTYRFINVKNGSDFYMDVHPGNPAFMSKQRGNIDSQHWLATSVKNIDDESYQTVFSNPTPSHSTTSSPTSDSSGSNTGSTSKGLSTGAAAGIGIGVGLGVIFIAVGGFLLWRRRRRNRAGASPGTTQAYGGEYDLVSKMTPDPPSSRGWAKSPPPGPPQEMSTEGLVSELDSTQRMPELDAQSSLERAHFQQL